MDEWGIFNSEGLVEGDFWTENAAMVAQVATEDTNDGEHYVARVCPSCRGAELGYCTCEDEGAVDHCTECGDPAQIRLTATGPALCGRCARVTDWASE